MIPETAVETIAKFMSQEAMDWVDVETDDHDHDLECTNWRAYKDDASNALEAALPYLEAALRKQIAADLRAFSGDYLVEEAARIAEKRAFHCCAHPKCPGGSICCCQDAEEGNTK